MTTARQKYQEDDNESGRYNETLDGFQVWSLQQGKNEAKQREEK